jgi:hypothetical protein
VNPFCFCELIVGLFWFQDDYAIRSFERALAAQSAGVLAREIVPVSIPSERKKGAPTVVEQDEGLGKVSSLVEGWNSGRKQRHHMVYTILWISGLVMFVLSCVTKINVWGHGFP